LEYTILEYRNSVYEGLEAEMRKGVYEFVRKQYQKERKRVYATWKLRKLREWMA
jgi:hypothetical protein